MPDTSTDQIAFLWGQETGLDDQVAFTYGLYNSAQDAFLRGHDTDLSNQDAFLWGRVAVSDSQACHVAAGGQLYDYIGACYLRGSLDATPVDTPAYLDGHILNKDSTPAFVNSGLIDDRRSSTKAYVAGKSPTSVPAYLTGTF